MHRIRIAGVVLAVWIALGPASAAEAPKEARCGAASLTSCMIMRVETLDQLAAELQRAAFMAPSGNLSKSELERVAEYDAWLKASSARAAALARTGRHALAGGQTEAQMSFNLQYLELQSQMQHENRSFTAISNIMKTKHDTAKNSISNVR